MAAVTICNDIWTPRKQSLSPFPLFPHPFAMKWWDQMPWSSSFECWVLSHLFHSPLFQFSFIIGRILWAYFFPFEISCTQLLKGPEPDLAIPMTDPIRQDGAILHDMGSLRDAPCYGITGLAGWACGECPVKLIMGIWNKEKVTKGGVLWRAVCSTDTR